MQALVAVAVPKLIPGALRAHRVVLADFGPDLIGLKQAMSHTVEPLLMAARVVDQPPPVAPLEDLADTFDAQASILDGSRAA